MELGFENGLPGELADIIMCMVQEEDPLSALYLALTCAREYVRYMRLGLFAQQRAIMRPLQVDRAYNEGTVCRYWAGEVLIPGDPGYAKWKAAEKKEDGQYANRCYKKQRMRNIRAREKQQRQMKQAWKRGDYE